MITTDLSDYPLGYDGLAGIGQISGDCGWFDHMHAPLSLEELRETLAVVIDVDPAFDEDEDDEDGEDNGGESGRAGALYRC